MAKLRPRYLILMTLLFNQILKGETPEALKASQKVNIN